MGATVQGATALLSSQLNYAPITTVTDATSLSAPLNGTGAASSASVVAR
jgi:hypothetical protein